MRGVYRRLALEHSEGAEVANSSSTERAVAVTTQFFESMGALQWDAMAACVANDVVRVGPFRDVKQGRDQYRDFLVEAIEQLEDYVLEMQRVWSDGERAVAQLSETYLVDGRPQRRDEALVLDIDTDGLIKRVEVYLQRSYFVDAEQEIPRSF